MSLAATAPAVWWEDFAPDKGSAPCIELEPTGQIDSGGWALGRLNDGADLDRTSFVYADTTTPVRLYLIDSAVDNSSGWFTGNPNLTLNESVAIRGASDNPAISAYEHGTHMLSIIAGPETGAALGTPIEVITFDVYPGGEGSTTTTTLLGEAVSQARLHHLNHSGTPGVICIAIGSSGAAVDEILEFKIEAAVAAGLTVVVSAGNQGEPAAQYIPSAYGQKDGVICVGASDANNQLLAGTNYGMAVDLFAPGQNVRAVDYPVPATGSYDQVNGTSPAAALATAAALTELSRSPFLRPAEVEATLKDSVYPSSVPLLQVVPPGDGDGDGVADLLESFFGSSTTDPTEQPARPVLAQAPEGVTLSFPMASALYDPENPHVLSNGASWRVMCSEDLEVWTEVTGTLETGAPSAGKIPASFTIETSAPTCFFRIEVTPAP